MTDSTPVTWLDSAAITETISETVSEDKAHILEILAKGRDRHGLDYSDVAALMTIQDPELMPGRMMIISKAVFSCRRREIAGSSPGP